MAFFHNATVYGTVFKSIKKFDRRYYQVTKSTIKGDFIAKFLKVLKSVSVQAPNAHISKDYEQITSHSTLAAKFKLKRQQFWSISAWSSYG